MIEFDCHGVLHHFLKKTFYQVTGKKKNYNFVLL